MKIGVIYHPNLNLNTFDQERLFKYLQIPRDGKIDIRRVEPSNPSAEVGDWHVDILVSVGGDGTFLTTARIAAAHTIPMIGVKIAAASAQSKPFLPDIQLNELAEFIEECLMAKHVCEHRHFLKAYIKRASTELSDMHLAINEISIGKSQLKGTVTVNVEVQQRDGTCVFKNDWQDVLTVRADLTMIATATGSTGYSMSAGGPLIHPEDASVVCAHVAPIGFGQRPLVLPGKYDVRMTVVYAQNTAVSFDCQDEFELGVGDQVYIRRGATYQVLRKPGWSFFARAKDVLNWGG